MFYKPEIREKMQDRRRRLDEVSRVQAGQMVAAQVVYLKEFLGAQHVGCYLPVEGELDPLPSMHCAQTLKKQLYLPVITASKQSLEFFSYRLGDKLVNNSHGIGEPESNVTQPVLPQNLDVIIVPLVAFDEYGNRLGRGAGHYDRTLAFIKEQMQQKSHAKPCLIGLAYDFQRIERIIPDKWDVPLDIVVTEKNIYFRPTP